MKLLAAFVLCGLTLFADDKDYVLGPDSQSQQGVPQGEVRKFTFADSKVFPGTSREWSEPEAMDFK